MIIYDNLLETIESLDTAGIPQHSVSPNQGKLLYTLALLCNAKNILEIGTLGGYSTIWLGRALPDDGCLISLEYNSLHAEVARKNITQASLESKVNIRVGKAIELLPQIETEIKTPFDLSLFGNERENFRVAINVSSSVNSCLATSAKPQRTESNASSRKSFMG